MADNTQIPYLLKDAVVSIDFHSDFVNHLQQTLNYLADGRTESDFALLKEHLEAKVPLVGWEHAFYIITAVVKSIHDRALATGKVVYKDLSDTSV